MNLRERMKHKMRDAKLDAMLKDNVSILSRFNWSTSSNYKKVMVAVFIFLIFLFLFRYPIIKWINKIPEPPVIELGECLVKGQGQLKIGHVHLTPSESSHSVIVTFSTNLATNSLIAVQYGTNPKMEFETFATVAEQENRSSSLYPYVYYTSILIASPGQQYYYRVTCAAVHSDTFSFHSWRYGSGWSPSIALVSGVLSENTVNALVHKRHKLSLVAHIDTHTTHSNDYASRIQQVTANVPFILLPAAGKDVKSAGSSSLFPLPGADWPVTKNTFHTVVGPVIFMGFNSRQMESSINWLAEELNSISTLRVSYPWLVVVSLDESFCLPTKTSTASTCQQLFNLFIKHKVDLYVTGVGLGYHRTWPIAWDGSALSTYHSAKGFVSVALGVREKRKSSTNSMLTSEHLMRNKSTVQDAYMTLEINSPGSMCMQVINPHSHLPVDHFCIEKAVNIELENHKAVFSGPEGTYDFTTWLCLVVILTVVFIGLLVFRKVVYTGVCKYMESNGGVPLYEGKLLTV